MELQRTVTIGVDGVTKSFGPKDDVSKLPKDVVGRLRRAGAFGDSAEALKGGDDAEAPAAVKLDDLTVPDLRKVAEERGVDLGEAKLKAGIIAVIEAAQK